MKDYKDIADIIEEIMAEYQKEQSVPLDNQTAFGLLGYVASKSSQKEQNEIL